MELVKNMKDTIRFKYDAVWAKPNIVKVNEMEMNDEMNELDFGTWNEQMSFGISNE